MTAKKRHLFLTVICILAVISLLCFAACQNGQGQGSQTSDTEISSNTEGSEATDITSNGTESRAETQSSEQTEGTEDTEGTDPIEQSSNTETTESEDTSDTHSESTSEEDVATNEETTTEGNSDLSEEQSSETVTEEHQHVYTNACDKFCNDCGESRKVGDHVYDYDCDVDCNECGKRRMVFSHNLNSNSSCENVTCVDCGYVKEQSHKFSTTGSTPATLMSSGYVISKCTKCGLVQNDQAVDQLTLEDLNMPVVYITDFANASISVEKLTKENGEIMLDFKFVSNSDEIQSFECTAKIKVQGATSAGFPKKNFNIKLYTDDTFTTKNKVDFGWGKQNKYCMKANWIDFSQARNVIGGKMFAEMVYSRTNLDPNLAKAPNGGVIDGFPILVYVNGKFHGLYTMNIPKDEWMFAMKGDETTREAMLMADDWTNYAGLTTELGEVSVVDDFAQYGFELEYCSTEDTDVQWVRDSFNELIRLLNCGDNERIREELPNHLDIEAGIDNMIFTYFLNAHDNVSKNILWATYDGKKWIPSMYDMDGSYGITWAGEPVTSYRHPSLAANGGVSAPGCKMYYILLTVFADEVEERYTFLRQEILTVENTKKHFDEFYAQAPMGAYDSDRARWLNVSAWCHPFYYTNLTNYEAATKESLSRLDKFFYNFNK